MPENVVNLRRRRKDKARRARKAAADRNAAAHGIPKPAADLARAREAKARAALEAHRIERAGDTPGDAPDDGA